MKTRSLSIASAALAFITLGSSVLSSQELSLMNTMFVSSTDWFLIDGLPARNPQRRAREELFRKYFIYIIDDKIDPRGAGYLANTTSFMCQKDAYNFLMFHIPDDVSTKIQRDERIPSMGVQILADDVSANFSGEYINGDIFIDLTLEQTNLVLRVMEARNIIVEFGPGKERLRLYQGDRAPNGTTDLKRFFTYVPLMVKTVGG